MKGTKIKDLRKLNETELKKKLEDMENTILVEKKSTKLRPIKKAIARINTLLNKKTEVK